MDFKKYKGCYYIFGRIPSDIEIFFKIFNYVVPLKIKVDLERGEKIKLKNLQVFFEDISKKSLKVLQRDLEEFGEFKCEQLYFRDDHHKLCGQNNRLSGFVMIFCP